MKDLSDLIEEWKDENRVHSFEGASGVNKLEKLVKAIGYSESGNFIGANPILNFLADNSGAIDAIIQWMGEQNVDDWQESLEAGLPDESYEEENNDSE